MAEDTGLTAAKLRLAKKYGIVMEPDLDMGWMTTGIKELDDILGGGLPRGRIVEVFGKESTGKSTLMLVLAKPFLEAGEHVVWADFEGVFDRAYATQMGLPGNHEKLIVVRPETMEQGFDIFYEFMKEQPRGVYVIDSLAAAMPDLEKVNEKKRSKGKSSIGDTAIGAHARALSTCLRQMNNQVAQCGASLVILNQMRTKLEGFYSYKTTTGGASLKFYTSIRLGLQRKDVQYRERAGRKLRCLLVSAQVKKTKVGPTEGQQVKLWIVPGVGIVVKKERKKADDLAAQLEMEGELKTEDLEETTDEVA